MKRFNLLMGIVAGVMLMTSCLNDEEPYRAGFYILRPASHAEACYANNTSDSLVLFSYGPWTLAPTGGFDASWVTVPVKHGSGYTYTSMLVTMEQNTTGEGRMAMFQLTDTDHPDEATATFAYFQYATRGDGSLGSAADVKTITGSDGSSIVIEYDQWHRPTSLVMEKNDLKLRQLSLKYSDTDSVLQVNEGLTEYRGVYGKDYQPVNLWSATDTIGYYSRFYSNGMPVSSNYVFNFMHHQAGKKPSGVTYLFPEDGVSLDPDSLHNADTLYYYKEDIRVMQLGLTYSSLDNRHQSVDVNQLLLGVEECDPYLLLSLFRYARNTSIIARARNKETDINVTTELNADKSVHSMTVVNGPETITYTFDY